MSSSAILVEDTAFVQSDLSTPVRCQYFVDSQTLGIWIMYHEYLHQCEAYVQYPTTLQESISSYAESRIAFQEISLMKIEYSRLEATVYCQGERIVKLSFPSLELLTSFALKISLNNSTESLGIEPLVDCFGAEITENILRVLDTMVIEYPQYFVTKQFLAKGAINNPKQKLYRGISLWASEIYIEKLRQIKSHLDHCKIPYNKMDDQEILFCFQVWLSNGFKVDQDGNLVEIGSNLVWIGNLISSAYGWLKSWF